MPNGFAIVSEGVTDYRVIRNVMIGFFKEQRAELILNPAQPDATANGESAWQQFGNWENVLRYLREKKHRDALEYNQYLVIQIDTDRSEDEHFGVSQQVGGVPCSPEQMLDRVAGKLREIIEPADCSFYGDRIIFAICVRDLECWLLPLWDIENADRCVGCIGALNRALPRQGERVITKNPEQHDHLSSGYRKRKVLMEDGVKNPSLARFIAELTSRNIQLTTP